MTADQTTQDTGDDQPATADLCERCYGTNTVVCGPPWCLNGA